MSIKKKKEKQPLHVSTVRALTLAAVLTVSVVVFTYCVSWGYYQSLIEAKAETNIFRTFVLDTLDGGKLEAQELRGTKLTAVNIWGTDCPPCISEMPELEELNNSYDDSVFRLIGIPDDVTDQEGGVIPDRLEEAKRILEASGVTFANVIPDEDMDAFLTLVISATPTTLFLDSDGNIIETITGTRNLEFWKETVDSLLAEVA